MKGSVSLIQASELIIGKEKKMAMNKKKKRTKLLGSYKKYESKLAMNDDQKT
jgi:hypothetical protein